MLSFPKLPIIKNDAHLNSVYNFLPGGTYYLVSFVTEQTSAGVLSENSSGGQCLDGLRMAFSVAEVPMEPTTTTELQNVTTTNSTDGSGDISPSTSEDPATMTTTTEEDLTMTTNGNSTGFIILPSVAIRDWHILVIALLGSALVSLLVLYVIASVVFVFYRRRRSDVIDTELKLGEPKYIPHPEKAEKVLYPEMFKDPLD